MSDLMAKAEIEKDFLSSSERIEDTLAALEPMPRERENATIRIMLDPKTPMNVRLLARNELVRSHSRLIYSIAMQYARKTGKTVEDLFQAGMLGAMTQAMDYDQNKNVKFISYIVWIVRCKILEEIGFQNDLIHCSRNKRDKFNTKKGHAEILASDKPEDLAFKSAIKKPLSIYDPVSGDGNGYDDRGMLWLDTIGSEDENLVSIIDVSEDEHLRKLIKTSITDSDLDLLRNSFLNCLSDREIGNLVGRSGERIRQKRDLILRKLAQELRKEQKKTGYVYNNNVDTCRIDKVFEI